MSSENEKPKKKQQHNYSRIFDYFAGGVVTIMIKGKSASNESEISSMMFSGYLLDECENFYYLGALDEVQAALSKTEILSIMIADADQEPDIEIPKGSAIQ